jgi:hypothetical protein
MHRFLLGGALLLSFTASVAAQEPPKVTTLFSRDLTDLPGKEGTMLIRGVCGWRSGPRPSP